MFLLLILSTGVCWTYSFLGVLLRNSHTTGFSLKTVVEILINERNRVENSHRWIKRRPTKLTRRKSRQRYQLAEGEFSDENHCWGWTVDAVLKVFQRERKPWTRWSRAVCALYLMCMRDKSLRCSMASAIFAILQPQTIPVLVSAKSWRLNWIKTNNDRGMAVAHPNA